jgi:hypothetical protein
MEDNRPAYSSAYIRHRIFFSPACGVPSRRTQMQPISYPPDFFRSGDAISMSLNRQSISIQIAIETSITVPEAKLFVDLVLQKNC